MKVPPKVVQTTTTVLFLSMVILTLGCENPIAFLDAFSKTPVAVAIVTSTAADDETQLIEEKNKAAENLVKDWAKPEVTLFITGRLHGYIEPCGCTGLTNQKGGLLRRHSCQKMLQAKGFDPISIDLGNQIRRVGQQATIKFKTAYKSIASAMQYDVIGMGIDDIRISVDDVVLGIAEAEADDKAPFTSGNMVFEDGAFTEPFKIIQRNGKKIGVLSLIGAEHIAKARGAGINKDYTLKMPELAIREVLGNGEFASCDLRVLMLQSDPENCKAIAAKFPYFHLLVTGGGAGDPTLEAESIPAASGNHVTQMIQCGTKGMYCGVVGIDFTEQGKKVRYQRVALDASFADSEPIKKIFLNYQRELKTLWTSGLLNDIKPRVHPSGHKFVGSDKCMDCHEEEFDIWKDGHEGDGGPHVRATADLTDPGERTWVTRNFDPECVSCHVTGWNAQNYYPYESGYQDLKKDHLLHGNGCENCHGPGSAHVQAENDGADDALLEKLRKEMIVTKEEARDTMCFSCHDLDNSPDYAEADDGWEKYWPTIAHGDDD